MFVCVCNNVKESDLVNAISQGAVSFEELQTITGVGANCGGCATYAQELVKDLVAADLFYSAA